MTENLVVVPTDDLVECSECGEPTVRALSNVVEDGSRVCNRCFYGSAPRLGRA